MLSNRNRMHGILALTLSGQTGAHRRPAQSMRSVEAVEAARSAGRLV